MSETMIERIASAMTMTSTTEAHIILNGEYYKYKGSLVYARLSSYSDGSQVVSFYINVRKGYESKSQEVSNAENVLQSSLISNTLYGIQVAGCGDLDSCIIKVSAELKLLILESQLYRSVRYVLSAHKDKTFLFSGNAVPQGTLNDLQRAFQKHAYSAYGELIYRKGSNKFIKRLKKFNRDFYQLQAAFVPVFIHFNDVYDPMLNNAAVEGSKLYQVAKEKNRFRENGSLSCYYLTHMEICKALGLKNFMRFTPMFLYRIYCGLLNPSDTNFPSASSEIVIRSQARVPFTPDSSKSVEENEVAKKAFEALFVKQDRFGLLEFEALLHSKINLLKSEELTPEERSTTEALVRDLQENYMRINTLLYACQAEAKVLASIGSVVLDNEAKKTPNSYYEYLKDANLRGRG